MPSAPSCIDNSWSSIIYKRWSNRHEGLGWHAPMVVPFCCWQCGVYMLAGPFSGLWLWLCNAFVNNWEQFFTEILNSGNCVKYNLHEALILYGTTGKSCHAFCDEKIAPAPGSSHIGGTPHQPEYLFYLPVAWAAFTCLLNSPLPPGYCSAGGWVGAHQSHQPIVLDSPWSHLW